MPRHDTEIRLRHMLDAAREAAQMAQGKSRGDLDTDRPLNLSWCGCWRSSARRRAVSRPVSANNTLAFRRCRSSACAIDSSTVTTSTFSGKLSPKICRR
jgi:hypothetical protein